MYFDLHFHPPGPFTTLISNKAPPYFCWRFPVKPSVLNIIEFENVFVCTLTFPTDVMASSAEKRNHCKWSTTTVNE